MNTPKVIKRAALQARVDFFSATYKALIVGRTVAPARKLLKKQGVGYIVQQFQLDSWKARVKEFNAIYSAAYRDSWNAEFNRNRREAQNKLSIKQVDNNFEVADRLRKSTSISVRFVRLGESWCAEGGKADIRKFVDYVRSNGGLAQRPECSDQWLSVFKFPEIEEQLCVN